MQPTSNAASGDAGTLECQRDFRDGALGLLSVAGGRHEGLGTGNRIVPLGSDYIELIGIVDPGEARESPLAKWLVEQIAEGDRPLGWCVQTDDLEAIENKLGKTAVAMSRLLPDKRRLRWRLVGLEQAMRSRFLPFFISWDDPEAHPGRTRLDHPSNPSRIAWVEVSGNINELRDLVDVEQVPVRCVEGLPRVRAFGIKTAAGEIVLR